MDIRDERLASDCKEIVVSDIVAVRRGGKFIGIYLKTGYTVWLSDYELEKIQQGAKGE